MPQKKIRFKDRIKRNDQKTRHKMASGIRKRMGVTRRSHNKFDYTDSDSRPMEAIIADIADGTAVPTQEFGLDPRGLTDLLMSAPAVNRKNPAAEDRKTGESGRQTSGKSSAAATAPAPRTSNKPQLPSELPADHPLAAVDTAVIEAEARRRRLEQEELKAKQANKNHYRHAGQPYVFWERVGLHPAILQALRTLRFSHPTPVQQEVLSHILDPEADVANPEKKKAAESEQGEKSAADGQSEEKRKKKKKKSATGSGAAVNNTDRDVIVSAETGSGKTLVFAIPVLNDLLKRLDEAAIAAGKSTPIVAQVISSASPADGKEVDGADKEDKETEGEREGQRREHGRKRSRSADTATGGKKSGGEASEKKKAKVTSKSTDSATVAVAAKDPTVYVEDFNRRLMHTLIVSPTRELAIQIKDALTALTKFCPHVSVGCIVGGMAQEKQQRVLNRHPHILICTPGRLWDLVEKNEGCYLGHSISRRLHYVVLDEADKLLQSGKFEQLKGMLERIHCETLPAGFVQEREEGAEVGEHELEAGRWDEEKRKFVPFTKEEKEATTKGKLADEKTKKTTTNKQGRRDVPDDAGELTESDDEEEEEEERDDEGDADAGKRNTRKKDQPRPIPMPAVPADNHRVITYVTSATLSLQTNYERRDYKSDKKIIRTSNADVMGKVLQQLEIKPSNANVFTVSPQADVAAKINETYLRCPDKSKDLYLYYFLRTYHDDRTIIFVNAISMLRRLVKIIEALGISVVGLHASMQQRQRLKFIDKFKTGTTKVLVATDIASRGLDIDGLKYVLHFQVPRTTEAYIHRCGRTARCGGTGLSLLMVNAQEHVSFKKLMESLGRKESEMEQFALQPTVVHQLHAHLRIALQIDKLQKEIDKTRASDRWVDRMNRAAELDVDDMKDEETAETNREKMKAIAVLKRELEQMQKKFTGSYGGKGAFRTGAHAMGAKQAEEKLRLRADRQTLKLKKF